jgi:hypothetical protein
VDTAVLELTHKLCFVPKLEIQLAFLGPFERQIPTQSYSLQYSKTGLWCEVTIYEGRFGERYITHGSGVILPTTDEVVFKSFEA